MTQFTSGTQARDGRTVNHDDRPWRNIADDTRWADNWSDWAQLVYDPRPEFAVLDNPILAEFRRGDTPNAGKALYYLKYLDLAPDEWRHLSPAAHDHARRVLELIRVVYGEEKEHV